MSVADQLLAAPLPYRLWQAPFAETKFAPVRRHNDLAAARRVLDVGCGPGTNARHFRETQYEGLDYNPRYIDYARSHFSGRFTVADANDFEPEDGALYDFVLVNSLLHHLDDDEVRNLLSSLSALLTDDGSIHIVELMWPKEGAVAQRLARWDRGDYPRSLDEWRQLFGERFEISVVDPFDLTVPGLTLWKMAYFKGTPL